MTEDQLQALGIFDPMEVEEHEPTNAVIYGYPGTGKTFLAATAPAPLILDFERGSTLTAKAVVKVTGNTGVRVKKIDTMDDLRKMYAFLVAGDHPFKSVVLDPIGEFQKILMQDIIKRFPSKRMYEDLPGMQDWGKASSEFIKTLQAFRALPLHTVIVAHAQQPENEEDVIKPMVQGKQQGPYLMGSMDLLAYMYVESGEKGEAPNRFLLTQANGRITAKNRGNHLPVIIQDPNLSTIFQVMESVD